MTMQNIDNAGSADMNDLSLSALAKNLAQGFGILIFLSVVLGLVYPAATTIAAQTALPHQANGSPVFYEGRPAGSALIGQDWTDTGLFEGRPSATGCDPKRSGASNLSVSSPDYQADVKARIARWQALTGSAAPVPADLAAASGSGLDPDITVEAALYQVPYVSKMTGLSRQALEAMIEAHAREDFLSFAESPIVNVLELNLAAAKAAGWSFEEIAARKKAQAEE